jgi:hypothetical protein
MLFQHSKTLLNFLVAGLIQSQYAEPTKLADASLWATDCLMQLFNATHHAAIECMCMMQSQLDVHIIIP